MRYAKRLSPLAQLVLVISLYASKNLGGLMRTLFIIWFAILLTVIVSGCEKTTYHKENIEASVINSIQKEYGLSVKCKFVGRTLCVAIHFNQLWKDGFIESKAWHAVGNIKFVTTRIFMSADAEIDFLKYMVSGDDSTEELHYIRAAIDEKLIRYGAMAIDAYQPPVGVISAEEYWDREVLIRKDYEGKDPVFEEMRWGEFMAHRISTQVEDKYQEAINKNTNIDAIDTFSGLYFAKDDKDNQMGRNLFALVIQSKADPKAIHFLQWMTEEVVRKTCKIYKTFPFESMRIYNQKTDHIFEVTT